MPDRGRLVVTLTAICLLVVATITLVGNNISAGSPSILHTGSSSWSWKNLWNGQQVLTEQDSSNEYLIGVGKADITGPVAEINFMGYADPNQLGSGLRQRLWSRAFIVGDIEESHERVVYLVLDTQSGDTAVRQGILDGLKDLGSEYSVYGQQNVAVTGTHSHSGPGAWLNYLLPQITSRGFDRQSYEAIVNGAIESIKIAHKSLTKGTITIGKTSLADVNVNRSPYAYLANPAYERAIYADDVDKDMTLLRFKTSRDDQDIGILTWFPVHGTSMLGNNTLVTGDNKGVAAALFEQYAKESTISNHDFVAGFSQANVGDTSPNVLGAYCESGDQAGEMCDFQTSLCAGKTGPCHGRGPHWGLDDAGTASTFEIGRRQYMGARSIFDSMEEGTFEVEALTGGIVRSLHVFVDFANRTFTLPNGTEARTCPAALGYSFAAGTTDGPGAFDFKQNNSGSPDANPIWSTIGNQLHEPGPDQIECHGAKPILLDVGETFTPYMWTPNIVDLQLFRIGSLFVIVSPGEATTMAGRRWKDTVAETARSIMDDKISASTPHVVLGGPANSYTHYIATREEYGIQRYEGASTLYGPHTLDGYLDLTRQYLPYLSSDSASSRDASHPPQKNGLPELQPGPSPPIQTNVSLNFISPVVRDGAPFFRSFGEVLEDVKPTYTLSLEAVPTIAATFVAGHPRNVVCETFATLEKYDRNTAVWESFRDDSDWSLLFEWKRTSSVLGTSVVRLSWELGWEVGVWGRADTTKTSLDEDYKSVEDLKGKYRLIYNGYSKALGGRLSPIRGVSGAFEIV